MLKGGIQCGNPKLKVSKYISSTALVNDFFGIYTVISYNFYFFFFFYKRHFLESGIHIINQKKVANIMKLIGEVNSLNSKTLHNNLVESTKIILLT